jgi:hypothetical protein
MISLAKLLRIRQEIGEEYKNMGLEKFRLSIFEVLSAIMYGKFDRSRNSANPEKNERICLLIIIR